MTWQGNGLKKENETILVTELKPTVFGILFAYFY